MILLIVGIILIVAAVAGGVWWYTRILHGCNPPLPRQTIQIGNTSFDVEMATTMIEQACGLSGREGLGDNQGMLFTFGSGSTQNFWMKDMTFALDMIWISGGKVAGFTQDVPPPPPNTMLWQLKIYPSPPNVDTVLEVNAGTVAKDGIQVGDAASGF
jgi:hypothetical protein